MSDNNFAAYIERERDRLHAEREAALKQQQELKNKLAEIDRELSAIDAYEAAKTGKAAPSRSTATRRARTARRGSKREQLLQMIRSAGGLSRGEILERMGLKGDRSGEMSVSNALTALIKATQVRRADGKYHAA